MLGMVNKAEADTSSKSLCRFTALERNKMEDKQMNSSTNELFLLVFMCSWFSTLALG